MEDLFEMPNMGPQKGSKEWLRIRKSCVNECEYSDIAEYEELMLAFIQYMQRIGDATGAVRVRTGEKVPDEAYKMQKLVNRGEVLKPRALSGHVKLR